jgi:hypothetical protein
VLPSIRQLKTPAERVNFFEAIEGRFAWQARATTLLVGITGFYLAYAWNLWARFNDISYWWMTLSPKARTRLPAGRALSFGFLPQAATVSSAIPIEIKPRRCIRTSFLFV